MQTGKLILLHNIVRLASLRTGVARFARVGRPGAQQQHGGRGDGDLFWLDTGTAPTAAGKIIGSLAILTAALK